MELKNLKPNETFYANTHAEFINKVFGTHFKAWIKRVFRFNEDYEFWMIRFDKNASKKVMDCWKTYYQDDIIKVTYCGDIPISHIRSLISCSNSPRMIQYFSGKKIVFEITGTKKNERTYVFRGVYEYQAEESIPPYIRIYKKISDNYELK